MSQGFKSHQQLYNSFANEWDLCEDFSFSSINDDSDSDCTYDSDGGYYDNSCPQESVSQPWPTLPASVEASAPLDFESDQSLSVLPYCTDPLEAMARVYGYLPCMGPTNRPSRHSWDSVLGFLGFVNRSELPEVEASEKNAMLNHFNALASKIGSKEADDLLVLHPGPNGSELLKMSPEWVGTWPQLMCCASVLSLSPICREAKEWV